MYEVTPCFGPPGSSNHHPIGAAELADPAVRVSQTGHGCSEQELNEDGEGDGGFGSNVGNCYNGDRHIDTHLLQEMILAASTGQLFPSGWDSASPHEMPRGFGIPTFAPSVLPHTTPFPPPTPAILNHFLPVFPGSGAVHDPSFDLDVQLGLPPPLALVRELLQSLPLNGSMLFGDGEGEHHDNPAEGGREGLVEIWNGGALKIGGEGNGGGKQPPDSERERRTQMKEKFDDLRMMIPNSTKADRVSVVGDAIGYIKELKRTVDELKLLVDKKRCERERRNGGKRQRTDQDHGGIESCLAIKSPGEPEASHSTGLRSSLLWRKSKATEVDVRIVNDEVTVKLVQWGKINCLLYVTRVLDELHLDLQHVTGGQIGNHCSFFFSSKIYEGSSVFASAVASKLLEAVDGHYAPAAADN